MTTDSRSAVVPSLQSDERQADIPDALARRVVIENVRPRIDDGRFPVKRTVGEQVDVVASIFADGHDVIVAVLRHRAVQGSRFRVQFRVQGSGCRVRNQEPRTLNPERTLNPAP